MDERDADEEWDDVTEKGHGRIECRNIKVWRNFLSVDEDWNLYLKELIVVTRQRDVFSTRTKTWKTSIEEAVFVSTFSTSAKQYATGTRDHWGVENKRHYVLDKTFHEDASRIRVNPFCAAKIRSFALDICRINQVKNVATTLYENALKPMKILAWKGISK